MKNLLVISILTFTCLALKAQDYSPPQSKESIVTDTFHEQYIIEDKYRWLEDVNSEETKEWISRQNKMSNKYLSKVRSKANTIKNISKYSYTKSLFPHKKGKYYFRYLLQTRFATPSLYYQNKFDSTPKLLIDPREISKKDKITLYDFELSKNSKFVAYQFSRNGSDWKEIKVLSIKNRKHKKDHLKGIKFSHIAWHEDGFYYSKIDQEGQFGNSIKQQIYYHKIGTDQEEDELIFERKNKPEVRFHFQLTSDERFFILKEIDEQKGQINVFYIDFNSDQTRIQPLIINTKGDVEFLDHHNGKLIAKTFKGANNGMIVEIDPTNPYEWKAITAQYEDALLTKALTCKDRIVAVYQVNQRSLITIFDYFGNVLFSKKLPIARSILAFSKSDSEDELYFYYTSHTIPRIVHKMNIKTFEIKQTKATTVNFTYKDIIYEEVEYVSKDSVLISMILVYQKGINRDGSNPTILKAYGGFGVVSTPVFDPGIVHFIKKGGIFAFANIRGGGDKGKKWALAGKGINKQNSFDDFIAAAEFLIKEKYTNEDKLGITGGSNGGLVVAVAALQRPDLFKAVVPIVAPMDMLRFEKFTVGHMHRDEYGTINEEISFKNLKNYSPYHNVQDNINYPSMLIITSENDDRVPPFHSYKFAARMQSRSAQTNPILLKVEKQSGHHGATTKVSSIMEKANIYGFIMNEVMK